MPITKLTATAKQMQLRKAILPDFQAKKRRIMHLAQI